MRPERKRNNGSLTTQYHIQYELSAFNKDYLDPSRQITICSIEASIYISTCIRYDVSCWLVFKDKYLNLKDVCSWQIAIASELK